MATRRRRNPDNELRYVVTISDWYAHCSFNDFSYINIFDSLPYEERNYMLLKGCLTGNPSKKVKKEIDVKIVIHPGEYGRYNPDEEVAPIGDISIHSRQNNDNNEKYLMFRVTVPLKSFEHIRAYLSFRADGEASLVGSDIKYRQGLIYYISFDGGSNRKP